MTTLKDWVERAQRITSDPNTIQGVIMIAQHPENGRFAFTTNESSNVVAVVTEHRVLLTNELKRLQALLPFECDIINRPEVRGGQLRFTVSEHEVSVISHEFSYGGQWGYLECMIDSEDPDGWLYAEDVLEIIKECEK